MRGQQNPSRRFRHKQRGYIGIGNRRVVGGLNARGRLAELLDSSEFYVPLTDSLLPQRCANNTQISYTGATTKTVQNNDGYLVTTLAGEARFSGGHRVRNLLGGNLLGATSSSNLSAAGGWSVNGTMAAAVGGVADPDGGSTAYTITATGASGQWYSALTGFVAGKALRNSIYIRRRTGTGNVYIINETIDKPDITSQLTTSWQRLSSLRTLTTNMYIGIELATSGDAVDIWHPQPEDVTAQTTQTAGPYVSVGALDYRNDIDPLYLSLPGTAGHYASSPDSAANSITGDLAIRAYVTLADWTPATDQAIVAKWLAAGGAGTRSYILVIDATTGKPHLYTTATGDGVYSGVCVATAAPTVADGSGLWLYVTFDADNGAAGSTTKFYTSTDGVTYTQLGTDVVLAGATSIADTTQTLTVGATATGAASLVNGRIHSVQLYADNLGTTPVVDFNPHRDAVTSTGTITSSTTGEVWTINGASSVVRNVLYHGAGVDAVKYYDTDILGNPISTSTLKGYLAEGARTNLCLQSNTFGTAPWGDLATPAGAQDARGPDGGTTGWTLTDNNAGAYEGKQQTLVAWSAGATGCYSILVGKKASSPVYPLVQFYYNVAASSVHYVIVNEVAGTITVGGTTNPGTSGCVSFNDDYWLVWLSGTQAGATLSTTLEFYPAGSTNGTTLSAAGQGSTVFACAQFESGATFPSSRIATTTASVARNADVLTYSSSGNVSATAQTLYAELSIADNTRNSSVLLVDDGTVNNRTFFLDGTISNTAARLFVTSGGATQVDSEAGTLTSGGLSKIAGSVAANSAIVACNGSVSAEDTAVTMPVGQTTIRVGGNTAATAQADCPVKNIRIWQRQLSGRDLQRITV